MVEGAMRDAEPRSADRLADRRLAGEHVVGRNRAVAAVDAEPGRGVALRVEIDDQDVLADRGERSAEIDGRCRLADTALLIGDGDGRRGRRFRGWVQ